MKSTQRCSLSIRIAAPFIRALSTLLRLNFGDWRGACGSYWAHTQHSLDMIIYMDVSREIRIYRFTSLNPLPGLACTSNQLFFSAQRVSHGSHIF